MRVEKGNYTYNYKVCGRQWEKEKHDKGGDGSGKFWRLVLKYSVGWEARERKNRVWNIKNYIVSIRTWYTLLTV